MRRRPPDDDASSVKETRASGGAQPGVDDDVSAEINV